MGLRESLKNLIVKTVVRAAVSTQLIQLAAKLLPFHK